MRVKYYFENLMIEEICLAYFEYLKNGDSSEEATRKISENYKEILERNTLLPLMIWLSLGYYQWELGRLVPKVKEKAKQAYINLIDRKDEFFVFDPYENYLDRSYAPQTTHRQMLNQAKKIVQSLDKEMVAEKKLRAQPMFPQIKKLVDHGVYAYKIECDIIQQQGENCYVYFMVDMSQREGGLPGSTDIPIYLYNYYSVNNIQALESMKNIYALESTYFKRRNNFPGLHWTSKNKINLRFMSSRNPSLGYKKITFLGKTDQIYLVKGEIEIRNLNDRHVIASIKFENFEEIIEIVLRTADSKYTLCKNNSLIGNIDLSDYDLVNL